MRQLLPTKRIYSSFSANEFSKFAGVDTAHEYDFESIS